MARHEEMRKVHGISTRHNRVGICTFTCSPAFGETTRPASTFWKFASNSNVIMGANTLRCCWKLSFPRAFWIAQRESSLCLCTLLAVDLRAISRFRSYSSTRTTDSMRIYAQGQDRIAITGQSGRRYRIEHALQDKGSLLGRVFLATYVVLTRAGTGF